jgi:two-component system response regulator NreC
MMKIRVLIADDHVVLRSGLKLLLDSQTDIEVVGEASDGIEAINKTLEINPDVLIMDITMPGQNGIDAIREIKNQLPSVAVLVLTMHEDKGHIIEAFKAGASGYIPKKAADNELVNAIKTVHKGESFIYSSLTKDLINEAVYGNNPEEAVKSEIHEQLARREIDILELVAQGYTNQQIADQLFLSIKTVETYKARIMEKLNLSSRVELVRFALQHGLLDKYVQPSEGSPQ